MPSISGGVPMRASGGPTGAGERFQHEHCFCSQVSLFLIFTLEAPFITEVEAESFTFLCHEQIHSWFISLSFGSCFNNIKSQHYAIHSYLGHHFKNGRGWRECSMVMSVLCSCRGHKFYPQHPCWVADTHL